MYYNDHNPPHFHADYGGSKAEYDIRTLECIVGNLPRRANSLVLEWANQHRDELLRNWELAREGDEIFKIDPLD